MVYERVCRSDFGPPGCCVVDVGAETSIQFRQVMLQLKDSLSTVVESAEGGTLNFMSLGRFDQQTTTRPHRDNGPDESLLLLGFEPSQVHSWIDVFDYTLCAHNCRMTPQLFLEQYNPMFEKGLSELLPYRSSVRSFDPLRYQIVVVNNSSAEYMEQGFSWQGLLHTAEIPEPDTNSRRIINSIQIGKFPVGTPESVSLDLIEDFRTTQTVRRRGYDAPERPDDS